MSASGRVIDAALAAAQVGVSGAWADVECWRQLRDAREALAQVVEILTHGVAS